MEILNYPKENEFDLLDFILNPETKSDLNETINNLGKLKKIKNEIVFHK